MGRWPSIHSTSVNKKWLMDFPLGEVLYSTCRWWMGIVMRFKGPTRPCLEARNLFSCFWFPFTFHSLSLLQKQSIITEKRKKIASDSIHSLVIPSSKWCLFLDRNAKLWKVLGKVKEFNSLFCFCFFFFNFRPSIL